MSGVLARRVVAILLPCAVLLVLWLAVVAPVLAVSDGFQDQRDALLMRIAADERVVAGESYWSGALIMAQIEAGRDEGARTEPSQALAAAGLQNDIQAILARDGGQVTTVQILPAAEEGGHETISVQMSMSLPAASVADFLRAVESHVPFMFVRAASFQAPDAMVAPSGAGAGAVVNLSCTIMAYRRI